MNSFELKNFLELIMCSDPWPCDWENEAAVKDFANEESRRHGYEDWVEAYHAF